MKEPARRLLLLIGLLLGQQIVASADSDASGVDGENPQAESDITRQVPDAREEALLDRTRQAVYDGCLRD
jgi:hypothetical protein